jgi:hypothetical protein
MTYTICTSQMWRDKHRQDRSYQRLELSHLSYVIQWRYDKAKEIAGQIEALYVDGAAGDIRRTARARQHSRGQTAANEEVGEQQSSSRNRRPVEKPKWSNP